MRKLALIPALFFMFLFAGCEPVEEYTDAQLEVFKELETGLWMRGYNETQGTWLRGMRFLEHYASPTEDESIMLPVQHGDGYWNEPSVSSNDEPIYYYVSEDGKSLDVYLRNHFHLISYSIIVAADGTMTLKAKSGGDVFYQYLYEK